MGTQWPLCLALLEIVSEGNSSHYTVREGVTRKNRRLMQQKQAVVYVYIHACIGIYYGNACWSKCTLTAGALFAFEMCTVDIKAYSLRLRANIYKSSTGAITLLAGCTDTVCVYICCILGMHGVQLSQGVNSATGWI
jgi:hypothetical protein